MQSSTTTQATCPSNLDGDAYASFLVGAVYSYTVKTQSIQDVGARYRPIEPYIQDNWQVSPKLTLNLGLRYDYLQPYHEVKDRIAFLNVNVINPIVGIPGVLEFAGFPNLANFHACPQLDVPPETAARSSPILTLHPATAPPRSSPITRTSSHASALPMRTRRPRSSAGGFAVNLTHAGGAGGNQGATAGTGNNGEFGATSQRLREHNQRSGSSS